MTFKTEAMTALLMKLAVGVATASTIAGGAAIIGGASTNAVQDQRLNTLEANAARMDELSNKLDETNKNVAVLNERLKHEVSNE